MSINFNKTFSKALLTSLLFTVTAATHADESASTSYRKELTSSQAFEIAMKTGKSSGILIGNEAVSMKASTRSTDATLIDVVKGDTLANGCQLLHMTLTQPNVPTRTGANAGNYVSKTKVTMCRDGRSPTIEVVECYVGMFNCMPPG